MVKANRIRAGVACEAGTRLCRLTLVKRARRAASRGVTLVEVLIVLAIMAIIAGGATALVFPELKKSRVRQAVLSCGEVRTITQSYIELDMNGNMEKCPTVQDLVDAKKLDKGKTDDPWGTPYKIHCEDGEISVTSAGADHKFDSPDDVKHNFKPADSERVGKL